MALWIVVGLVGFGVWVHGILAFDGGQQLPGWLEIIMGGMLMFLALNFNPRRQSRRSDRAS